MNIIKTHQRNKVLDFSSKICKVIINADDFGITKGVNKAIFELVDAKVLTSTSVMTNMPYYNRVENLKNEIGIGIHLNLTVGNPVLEKTKISTLVNDKGDFLGLNILLNKMIRRKISKIEVEAEFEGQIKKLLDIGIQPDHVNTHESLMKYPFFLSIIRKLAYKYKIMGVRTYSPRKFNYKRLLSLKRILISSLLYYQKLRWVKAGYNVSTKFDSLLKINLDYKEAIELLNEIFQNLPSGILEIIVHPGYCNEENATLGDYIYEREVELKALLSSEFKTILDNSGATLISFNDICNSK